jgi:hypothetical protein
MYFKCATILLDLITTLTCDLAYHSTLFNLFYVLQLLRLLVLVIYALTKSLDFVRFEGNVQNRA